MHPLLSIQNLSIGFRSGENITPATDNISFDVHRGEIVALVGESGSGKSITSLSVLQLLPKSSAVYLSGKILFSDNGASQQDLLTLSVHDINSIRGNRIGMIFQEPMTSLNPVFTCGDQVSEVLRKHQHLSFKQARSKVVSLFQQVQLPDPEQLYDRYPHQLSGGQKQRVMIAMAMCCSPSLLICDEPTTALDVTVQQNILRLIKEMQKQLNIGVIFITHDLGVVSEIADRAIVLYHGKMVEQGKVTDLFSAPKHPYTKALLQCRPALHPPGERLPVVSDFLNDDTPEQPVKKQSKNNQVVNVNAQASDPILEVDDLRVWYSQKAGGIFSGKRVTKAVDGVTFTVYRGETLGLVGESGCGKSTLGRCLLKLVDPTSGTIRFNGKDLQTYRSGELIKMRRWIQLIFQDPYSSLNPRITIGDAINEVLRVHEPGLNSAERIARVTDMLEKVNLNADHYNRYPHEFSGGQRQRIVIARALILKPAFVVCDECVSALDVSVQAQVLNLLNDLKSTMGFTVIFISHDLSVVHYLSNRIMVMNKGRIEELGTAQQVYNQPKQPYTQKLLAAIPKI